MISQSRSTPSPYRLTIFLTACLSIIGLASLFVGVMDLNFLELFSDPEALELLLISRLPRLLAIILAGMGLAVAGLIMQSLCANKFVSPSTAATISSAQLGILLAFLFLPNSTIVGRALFSFAFALAGTWIFISFIQRVQMRDIVLIPLVGIMLGNIIAGITNFLAFKFDMTQALSSFTVGHFSTVIRGHYEMVYLVLPLVLLACFFARYFNIVGMGKNFASNLGINYQLFLFIGLTIAAMITASVVVVVGTISYIGLIVPNLVTIYKGDNLKNTIIDTALSGALFVLCCDLIGRVIIAPYELPIELVAGCLGSLLFIALIFYRLQGKPTRHNVLNTAKSLLLGNATMSGNACASTSTNVTAYPELSSSVAVSSTSSTLGASHASSTATKK